MIGDVEFNSSYFYKYFSLDTENFLTNIYQNKRDKTTKELLQKTLSAFIKAAVYSNPSGKQNTFAANQLPSAILIELREKKIPVNYANAFLKPARAIERMDLVEASLAALVPHVNTITKKYSLSPKKRLWFVERDIQGVTDALESAQNCETIDILLEELTKAL
jgi:CRISPR system Cascade subunit CasC